MKRKLYYGVWLIVCGFATTACEQEDTPTVSSKLEITSEMPEGTPIMMVPGDTFRIKFKAENVTQLSANTDDNWKTITDLSGGEVKVIPAENAQGNSQYKMVLTDQNGEKSKEIWFYCVSDFSDPKGTFVLNEGNMTSENGSLTYITPEGYALDNAYKRVNGSELGNVCQDLCIHDGKIYIISQNGDKNPVGTSFNNDGMLVIADAHTLKKTDTFKKEELSKLTWPSHIAVLDDSHVYIRDNGAADGDSGKGKVWRLDTKTRALTVVSGTEGAPKAPLYVKDGHVYTYTYTDEGSLQYLYIVEISPTSDQAKKNRRSVFNVTPKGILPTQKANGFWVLLENSKDQTYSIGQVEIKSYGVSALQSSPLEDVPNDGASGVRMVSTADSVFYYTSGTTLIKGTYTEAGVGTSSGTKPVVKTTPLADLSELDDNARIVYNGLGIHPATGHLYVNTIKGFGGLYTTNTIWEFDPKGDFTQAAHQWNNYTRFPAGFFFPAGK